MNSEDFNNRMRKIDRNLKTANRLITVSWFFILVAVVCLIIAAVEHWA